jgi:methylenetetrahydrofolate reductase (NADPH)
MSLTDGLGQKGFWLLSEVDPPRGADPSTFLDGVTGIKGRVDAVAVTDGAHAIMRMTPLAPCRLLLDRNMEPVMVINGRDRNRISFQGDLLAAWALGVKSVLIKEGLAASSGDQPMAKSAGDLNLEMMLQCVQRLNDGKDLAGETLQGQTGFTAGAIIDVSDDDGKNRRKAEGFSRLAELGVRFVVLGPTYDVNIIDIFKEAADESGIDLFASIMFLKSVAMVRYLNDLPGAPSVPNEFLKQMMSNPVKKQAGMEIAKSFLKDIESKCRGAVLIALGWGNRLPEFLTLIGR